MAIEKNKSTMSDVKPSSANQQTSRPQCGIIMPISEIDGLSENHWKEVYSIISDVIESANFEPNLVSNANDIGIIQKRIIQNIYNNPIVVCDVSAKNPNVMFELGMRLAFDKPTVIIKDNATAYNFDTSPIEHLTYPRDLRFSTIIEFKNDLKKKLLATYKKSQEDPNYSTFLKHFGEYKIADIGEREVSSEKYIVESIEKLVNDVSNIKHSIVKSSKSNGFPTINLNSAIITSGIIDPMITSYIKEFAKLKGTDADSLDQSHRLELISYVVSSMKEAGFNESEKLIGKVITVIDNTILPF